MDAAVAPLFARQHALLLRSQAIAAGATNSMIQTRLDTGRWVVVVRGLYRLAGVPVTWRQRALAACLVSGPGAMVSHRSAAVLWGVSGFRPGPIDVTVPAGRSGRNALARVHRSRAISGVVRDRIPVTRPARTLLDLAGVVSGALLEEAVDDVLCRRLCRLEDLAPAPRKKGSAALRTVLDAWCPGALPDGVAEMRIVRQLLAAGLAQPVRQHQIRSGGQFVARVDLAYPDHRLAIELAGFRWHAGPGPCRSDRIRGNRIEAAGWRLLRAAPEDGDTVVASARALLPRAA